MPAELGDQQLRDLGSVAKLKIRTRIFDTDGLTKEMKSQGLTDESITSCNITAQTVGDIISNNQTEGVTVKPDTPQTQLINDIENLASRGKFVCVTFSPNHFYSFSAFGDSEYQIYQGYQEQYNLVDWMAPGNGYGQRPKAAVLHGVRTLLTHEDAAARGAAAGSLFGCGAAGDTPQIQQDFGGGLPRIVGIAHKQL